MKFILKRYTKLKLFWYYKFNVLITQSININTTTIFEKQLLIDSIHALPEDILRVIKENVFHEREVLYKKKKDLTMKAINIAYSNYSDNDDENEHWGFFAENKTINNHIFNSYHCRVCGNYYSLQDTQNPYTSVPFSENIWCRCNIIREDEIAGGIIVHPLEYDDDTFPYIEEIMDEDEDPSYYDEVDEVDEYDEFEKRVDFYRDEQERMYGDDNDDFDDIGLFNSYRQR